MNGVQIIADWWHFKTQRLYHADYYNFFRIHQFSDRKGRMLISAILNHDCYKYLIPPGHGHYLNITELMEDLHWDYNRISHYLQFIQNKVRSNCPDFDVFQDLFHSDIYNSLSYLFYHIGEVIEKDWNVCTEILLKLVRLNEINSNHRTTTVISLANEIYKNKNFSAMPILADALQDAEYEQENVLDDLRNTENYWFRGCSILDEILEKS